MFRAFDQFDEAFSQPGTGQATPRPIRRRKTLKQRFVFVVANLLILPVIGLVYAVVSADGIRQLMPIFQRRLYQLPVPGAGVLQRFDGWNRADLAIVVALLLFAVLTWLWTRVFLELQGYGPIAMQRLRTPIVFYLLTFLAGVIIVFDAGLFYFGLASQTSSGWSDVPDFVVPAATLLYACGLAVLGWWHSDYSTSSYA